MVGVRPTTMRETTVVDALVDSVVVVTTSLPAEKRRHRVSGAPTDGAFFNERTVFTSSRSHVSKGESAMTIYIIRHQ